MNGFLDPRLQALVPLGQALRQRNYRFTTVTPATHARVNARPENQRAADLPGVFGWSRTFVDGVLGERMLALLEAGGLLRRHRNHWRSAVRWSSLDDLLFAHSAYPTLEPDAVFFGPDTYRFARALHQLLATSDGPVRRAVDIGCGAGPGAILLARACPRAEVSAVDINPRALDFTRANAQLAGVEQVQVRHSDLLANLDGEFDLILSNPPYLLDASERAYRHGGGELGCGLSLRIVEQALQRLGPGGRLLLYSGAAVVNGESVLRRRLEEMLDVPGWRWELQEIDPDVFGEELETPAYRHVERIAAVTLVLQRRD
ncbi:class I SAM-dependent methyltransferase [Pseudomonas sp. LA21]|uniref:class I SAM-dependent methyltransferase n=1 Tax=Pseudomonas sp. LA21 TaxID=2893373 RepID=UPI001FB6A782|nr:class I SAM-dependent methyltransferase [Pseudomonas sp. LA21]MCJ1886985.1 class I SAM-dependent methyltransferase [Pseudomonas sp. LA21]